MFYSPIYFLFYWMRANGVLPLDIPSWLCMAMSDTVHLGRIVTSFNSLFVVIVRYIYIVHDGKANQWHFERVGRRFQIASMVVPLFLTAIMLLSVDPFPAEGNLDPQVEPAGSLIPVFTATSSAPAVS